jgi:hypothetical protein
VRRSVRLLLRLAVATILAALIGGLTSLIPAAGPEPWLVVLTAVAAALAAQLGAALRAHASPAWRASALLATGSLAIAMVYGAAALALARAQMAASVELEDVVLILVPATVSALGVGLLLGPLLAGGKRAVALVISLLAPLIVALDGIALAVGGGLVARLTYTPCPPHRFCIDFGPWAFC